ncbi:MAG: ABC transporter substrate-binding protein, partial [Lachnospiraceae bacterium]|nr:ABC transporter substrate-binding protein [Lachnospiraceae bacterium]
MKKSTKLVSLILAGAMALSMTGCSSKPAETTAAATTVAETTAAAADTTAAAADGETYKIGVLQLVQHAALDQSNEG